MAIALALAGMAFAGGVQAQGDRPGPIAVHGNITTLEIAPVLLAAKQHYPDGATVKMGGIANLVGEPAVAGFGTDGVADVATHAETQALRYSVRNPNLRIILTVTEGHYRIVARRSAGIAKLTDLKGKRIATVPPTSAGYFLNVMLKSAGLSLADVQSVPVTPLSDMPKALAEGRVDAVVIWEPYSENAVRALGADAIEFDGAGVYRERFNLNSTTERLADPVERRKIVLFVRAVIDAAAAMRKNPAQAQALVAQSGNFTLEEVAHAWPHHGFITALPADLLDVLVPEERWLAGEEKRAPRDRATLARLIDPSIYKEAMALRAGK